MMATGSSERGLSEVSDDHVGQPGGRRAHLGRLPAVTVAAAPEHADHPARLRPVRRAAARATSSPAGVWA